jgi:hypothetical protein
VTTPTATHGRLTAKGRIYADKDTVAAVEARIPPEYEVSVQRASDGVYWLVYLHLANGGGRVRPGPVRVSGGLPLREAALFALEHWTATGVLG